MLSWGLVLKVIYLNIVSLSFYRMHFSWIFEFAVCKVIVISVGFVFDCDGGLVILLEYKTR